MTNKITAQAILNQGKKFSRDFINEVKLKDENEKELRKLGFDITSSSIISIGISAEISLFEQVFKTKISKRNKLKGELADTFHFESNPVIPDNLTSISDIVFTPTIMLHSNG